MHEADAGLHLRKLFALYRKLDQALGEATVAGDEQASDALLRAQSRVLSKAISLPSSDFASVMYKLALWRWDNPGIADIDADASGMTRTDLIAYSAFLDLCNLLGEPAVLRDGDGL